MFALRSDICRLCLSQTNEFSESLIECKKFQSILRKFFSIQITSDDILPQRICATCYDTIDNFLNLKTISLQSTVLLKKYIEAPPAKNAEEFKSFIENMKSESYNNGSLTSELKFDDDYSWIKNIAAIDEIPPKVTDRFTNCNECGKKIRSTSLIAHVNLFHKQKSNREVNAKWTNDRDGSLSSDECENVPDDSVIDHSDESNDDDERERTANEKQNFLGSSTKKDKRVKPVDPFLVATKLEDGSFNLEYGEDTKENMETFENESSSSEYVPDVECEQSESERSQRSKKRVKCTHCGLSLPKGSYWSHVRKQHTKNETVIDSGESDGSEYTPDGEREKLNVVQGRVKCKHCNLELRKESYWRHMKRKHMHTVQENQIKTENKHKKLINDKSSDKSDGSEYKPDGEKEKLNVVQGRVKCKHCNLDLRRESYWRHIRRKHPSKPYSDNNEVDTEIKCKKNITPPERVNCKFCNLELRRESYSRHMKRRHGKQGNLSTLRRKFIVGGLDAHENGDDGEIVNDSVPSALSAHPQLLTSEEIHKMLDITEDDAIFCRHCYRETTRGKLQDHFAVVHPDVEYKSSDYQVGILGQIPSNGRGFVNCNVCFKRLREDSLRKHIRVYHIKFNRLKRIQMRSMNPVTKCQQCQADVFISSLKKHMSEEHQVTWFDLNITCPVCSIKVRSSSYRRHVLRKHSGREMILQKGVTYEELSRDGEKMRQELNRDKANANEKVVCFECGKLYPRSKIPAHLNNHHSKPRRKYPKREKTHFCLQCGKGLTTKHSLVTHMRCHTDERPYACPHCPQRFRRRFTLYNHIPLHTGERRHTCKICSKDFVQKVSYNAHMRIHTGEKPHECNICFKQFIQSSALKQHLRTHLSHARARVSPDNTVAFIPQY